MNKVNKLNNWLFQRNEESVKEGTSDERYTKRGTVTPLLEFLNPKHTVWCPFDTADSQYVKIFKKNGNKVIYTHKDAGQDFLEYTPKEHFDVVISNPPFTGKALIFQKLKELNVPFAILMTAVWLNDAAPFDLFKDYELQLMIFRERASFTNIESTTQANFKAIYFCHEFLNKQIVWRNLESDVEPSLYRGKS